MSRDDEIKLKVATIIDEAVGEKKISRRRFLVWAGSACAVILISSMAFAFYLNNSPLKPSADAPQGKITSPSPGSKTARQFNLTGYTKNIPAERSHIWLTVNVKDLGLCWPKKPHIKANSRFTIPFHEEGPKKEFTVCLPQRCKSRECCKSKTSTGAAVVYYCNPLVTKEMRYARLSHRVKNMTIVS